MTDRDVVLERVCSVVRDQRGDVDDLVDAAVRRIAPLATGDERRSIRSAAVARMTGLGELDELMDDPSVDEILVTGRRVWVDRGGRVAEAGELTTTSVEQIVERILAPLGRRVDRTSPVVDARLANGSRVCAVVEPVAVGGSSLSIRRFAATVRPVGDFVDPDGAELLREIVDRRCNVVVSGATPPLAKQ
ncbi:ATPase, T2SS/T4P/T4SS family [Ilumatobacter sp.]|uniref:ATPase, T2SS/T4P/T4SS family n=1 Tax=Ilumatobacter sp. TaxID=1967498 RepID=UPI003B522251